MIPYLTFEGANFLIWCIKCLCEHQPILWGESAVSILTCINNDYMGLYGRLWFLPCMFIADMYVWVVLRFFRKQRFPLILSVLVLFSASFVTVKIISIRLPFTMDTALFASAFILLGYIFGNVINVLVNKGNEVYKIILLIGMLHI